MSNNQPNLNQLQDKIPEAPTIAKGHCFNCKTPLELPFPPIVLHEAVVCSSMVIPHTQGISCPSCGLYHNLRLDPQAIVLSLVIVPMEEPQLNENKKIIPFAGHLRTIKAT